MYKAILTETGEEVIILDAKWRSRIPYLRNLDHKDLLVCQGCDQPVRVRAGHYKRWHFAHKHLANCPYSQASASRLTARAILYDWLKLKFKESVFIEKQLAWKGEHYYVVDCWVQIGNVAFIYQIIENRMMPEDRQNLMSVLKEVVGETHWVFLSDMLREDETEVESVHLTTTEREFMEQSSFDEMYSRYIYQHGKSLHYLNPNAGELTTFRNLNLVHSPQLFKGHKQNHLMTEVLVYPKTGEFVHPGEWDKKVEFDNEKAERERKKHKAQEYYSNSGRIIQRVEARPVTSNESTGNVPLDNNSQPISNLSRQESIDDKNTVFSNYQPERKVGKCVICGEETDDWWWFDGVTKNCKCRKCLKKGKSTAPSST